MKIALPLGLFAFLVLIPSTLLPRDAPPVVSTEWLAQNLKIPGLVVLDIRSLEQYKKNHISGALHAPFGAWAVGINGLTMELPSDEALRALLGGLGISRDSIVIVVGRGDSDFARADATRVAWTCMLAGVKTVSVLDGGHRKWAKESRATSTEIAERAASSTYAGTVDRSTLASRDHVLRRIGKAVIVDTRVPEDYFGAASRAGHIRSAVNLPAPWMFSGDGVFKSDSELQGMASGVIGKNKSREVILYCDVGGYASAWWFVLTQMLGYQNVKVYDGSIQEWIKDPGAPLTNYSWH